MTKIPVDAGSLTDVLTGTRLLIPVVQAAMSLRHACETDNGPLYDASFKSMCVALDAIDERLKAGQ